MTYCVRSLYEMRHLCDLDNNALKTVADSLVDYMMGCWVAAAQDEWADSVSGMKVNDSDDTSVQSHLAQLLD